MGVLGDYQASTEVFLESHVINAIEDHLVLSFAKAHTIALINIKKDAKTNFSKSL